MYIFGIEKGTCYWEILYSDNRILVWLNCNLRFIIYLKYYQVLSATEDILRFLNIKYIADTE